MVIPAYHYEFAVNLFAFVTQRLTERCAAKPEFCQYFSNFTIWGDVCSDYKYLEYCLKLLELLMCS